MPRLAHVRLRLPVQEDLLQLVVRQIGEVHFCFPRIEAGQPTVCSETCVGRIRYLGVVLYDADRIEEAASRAGRAAISTRRNSKCFSIRIDPKVQAQARADGISEAWLEAAKRSPVWKMAMDWKIAFPLHPEYRTLPMVWYVPPLSPIQAAAAKGDLGEVGGMPDVQLAAHPGRSTSPTCSPPARTEPVAAGAGTHAGHARLHARAKPSTASSTTASPSGSA